MVRYLSAHARLAGELTGKEHLDGDDAVEADLSRLVNDAHAATGDFLEEFVVAEGAHAGLRGRHGPRALFGGKGRRPGSAGRDGRTQSQLGQAPAAESPQADAGGCRAAFR